MQRCFPPEGPHELILLAVEDITDRKRAERELREADRRKDEFLAMLAHELRNPLAPIRNALHLIRLSERGLRPETRGPRYYRATGRNPGPAGR